MLRDLIARPLSHHPCCVSQDVRTREVAQLMKSKNVGCGLVTRGRSRVPIGITADRDLATRCLADLLSPERATAREVLTPNVRTAQESAGLYDCIRAMNEGGASGAFRLWIPAETQWECSFLATFSDS